MQKTTGVISVSSNSCSISDSDESELRPALRKKPIKRSRKGYPVKIAHVPKRCFDYVQRRIKKKRPVIDLKTQTVEKSNCNRFIMAQIKGNEMETISPESITRLIWEMKNCVQRQDYGELAKLICMFTEFPIGKARWYPTVLRYCFIVLLYDPLVKGTGLIDLFLEGVVGCRTEDDKKAFLQDINRLPCNIHVSKYEDLWTPYPIPNQFNTETLNKLCETLSKRVDLNDEIKHEDDDNEVEDAENDSDWESYDENDSSVEEVTGNETTEPENTCDINNELNKLMEVIK